MGVSAIFIRKARRHLRRRTAIALMVLGAACAGALLARMVYPEILPTLDMLTIVFYLTIAVTLMAVIRNLIGLIIQMTHRLAIVVTAISFTIGGITLVAAKTTNAALSYIDFLPILISSCIAERFVRDRLKSGIKTTFERLANTLLVVLAIFLLLSEESIRHGPSQSGEDHTGASAHREPHRQGTRPEKNPLLLHGPPMLVRESILDILDSYRRLHGLEHNDRFTVVIDEGHLREGFKQELKTIYDLRRVEMFATGSSSPFVTERGPFLRGRPSWRAFLSASPNTST